LSWAASQNTSEYIIEISNFPNSGYSEIARTAFTTYAVTGLANGAEIFVYVKAANANDVSAPAQTSGTPNPVNTAPSAPVLEALAGDTQAPISWSAPNGATSYRLERSFNNVAWGVVSSGLTVTNYLDTGLANGTRVYYRVFALNAFGESGASNVDSVVPKSGVVAPPAGTTSNAALISFYQSYAERPTALPPGNKLFVDAINGSDANVGIESSPFKTVQHAIDVMLTNTSIILKSNIREYITCFLNGRNLTIMSMPGQHYEFDGIDRPRMANTTYWAGPAKWEGGIIYNSYTLFRLTTGGATFRMFDVSFKNSFGDAVVWRGGNGTVYGERVAFYNNEGHGWNLDDNASNAVWEFNVFKSFNNRNYRWFNNNPGTGSFDWGDGLKSSGGSAFTLRFGVVYGNGDDNFDAWASYGPSLIEYCVFADAGRLPANNTRQNNTYYPENAIIVRQGSGSGWNAPGFNDGFLYRNIAPGGGTTGSSPPSFPKLNEAPSDSNQGKSYLDSQPTVNDGTCIWQVYSTYAANGNGFKGGGTSPQDKNLTVRNCIFWGSITRQYDDNHGGDNNLNHCTIYTGAGGGGIVFDKSGPRDSMQNSYYEGYSTYNGSIEPLLANNQTGSPGSRFISTTPPTLPSDPTLNPVNHWWWDIYISDFLKPSPNSSLLAAGNDGKDVGCWQAIDARV
jgi:hypothetical protein